MFLKATIFWKICTLEIFYNVAPYVFPILLFQLAPIHCDKYLPSPYNENFLRSKLYKSKITEFLALDIYCSINILLWVRKWTEKFNDVLHITQLIKNWTRTKGQFSYLLLEEVPVQDGAIGDSWTYLLPQTHRMNSYTVSNSLWKKLENSWVIPT